MKMENIPVEGWHKITRFQDDASGLDAIISVHDATLGPGCGGCRIFPYASVDAALDDVKNLSRAMSYKNALGGIPFGGGKAVIIADPAKDKSPALFEAFGRALNELEGLYYTAEDSGITEDDIAIINSVSNYVGGVGGREIGGNPAPFTARGVWRGIQAAARHKLGVQSLEGVSVCILGVGGVGMALAKLLHDEGATLTVADVNEKSVASAAENFGATVVSPDEAAAQDVEIYAPCALGGAINETSLEQLRAKIVAGAANNQLKSPAYDQTLMDRGILYAPDFVINAAGVISVGLEILGDWTEAGLNSSIDRIGTTLDGIFARSAKEGRPTGQIADQMALEIIEKGPTGQHRAAE